MNNYHYNKLYVKLLMPLTLETDCKLNQRKNGKIYFRVRVQNRKLNCPCDLKVKSNSLPHNIRRTCLIKPQFIPFPINNIDFNMKFDRFH